MISVDRLAANRANARRSTGPKTRDGKASAARNARRHGLELTALRDPTLSGEIEALAREIAGADAGAQRHAAACRIAAAQIDLVACGARAATSSPRRRTIPSSPPGWRRSTVTSGARCRGASSRSGISTRRDSPVRGGRHFGGTNPTAILAERTQPPFWRNEPNRHFGGTNPTPPFWRNEPNGWKLIDNWRVGRRSNPGEASIICSTLRLLTAARCSSVRPNFRH